MACWFRQDHKLFCSSCSMNEMTPGPLWAAKMLLCILLSTQEQTTMALKLAHVKYFCVAIGSCMLEWSRKTHQPTIIIWIGPKHLEWVESLWVCWLVWLPWSFQQVDTSCRVRNKSCTFSHPYLHLHVLQLWDSTIHHKMDLSGHGPLLHTVGSS